MIQGFAISVDFLRASGWWWFPQNARCESPASTASMAVHPYIGRLYAGIVDLRLSDK